MYELPGNHMRGNGRRLKLEQIVTSAESTVLQNNGIFNFHGEPVCVFTPGWSSRQTIGGRATHYGERAGKTPALATSDI